MCPFCFETEPGIHKSIKIHLDRKQTGCLPTTIIPSGKNLNIVRVSNFLEQTFHYRM